MGLHGAGELGDKHEKPLLEVVDLFLLHLKTTGGVLQVTCNEKRRGDGYLRASYTLKTSSKYIAGRVLSGPNILGGNSGGRAGVIIVKQELCVFNCPKFSCILINFLYIFGVETEPLVGETHPAGLYVDKPLAGNIHTERRDISMICIYM